MTHNHGTFFTNTVCGPSPPLAGGGGCGWGSQHHPLHYLVLVRRWPGGVGLFSWRDDNRAPRDGASIFCNHYLIMIIVELLSLVLLATVWVPRNPPLHTYLYGRLVLLYDTLHTLPAPSKQRGSQETYIARKFRGNKKVVGGYTEVNAEHTLSKNN